MVTSQSILVLTGDEDPTADAVIDEILRRGRRVARFDIGDLPMNARLNAIHDGDGWYGTITGPDSTVDLEDISAIYYRRPSRFTFLAGMSTADRAYAEAEARIGFGGVLAALPGLWVNHPHHIARAEMKPLQLSTASSLGLVTAPTLVGNDASEIQKFVELVDGPIVCKTLSSLVLAENGQHKITYTTLVNPTVIDSASFEATAHLMQAWIPKAWECRVMVVGEQVLAVAIHAGSSRSQVDWRSDYESLRYEKVDVPSEIAKRTQAYLGAFDLKYGAFDFVVTPDDEWVMLECNPSGQWLWLCDFADLPIPAAFADLLIGDAG